MVAAATSVVTEILSALLADMLDFELDFDLAAIDDDFTLADDLHSDLAGAKLFSSSLSEFMISVLYYYAENNKINYDIITILAAAK